MARMDWALLAESAKLDAGGTVSMLGGSFTRLLVPNTPTQVPVSIVGRVLMEGQTRSARLRVLVAGPDDSFKISVDSEVAPPTDAPIPGIPPATLIVLSTLLPVPQAGEYKIEVQVEDDDPLTLKFVVVVQEPSVEA